MRKTLWLLVLGALSFFTIAQDRTLYEETIYNKPDIQVQSEVYLGDRMLVQQIGEWKECLTPLKSYTVPNGWGWTAVYKANEPICKRSPTDKHYWPTYINGSNTSGTERVDRVSWKEKKGKYKLCQIYNGFASSCVKKLSENDVKMGETFVYNENSFQQTIAYEGKSGNILKFNYAEFTDGFAREAFSREFQVDLTEGSIAAYKGAIIEVIEANNMQIKYKVIRNFSSDR
jgi:hypothetical protein|tara:strand:+ start:286 stop:975 length:690 start_codon:yes stop_codon:yes gene_type:complete